MARRLLNRNICTFAEHVKDKTSVNMGGIYLLERANLLWISNHSRLYIYLMHCSKYAEVLVENAPLSILHHMGPAFQLGPHLFFLSLLHNMILWTMVEACLSLTVGSTHTYNTVCNKNRHQDTTSWSVCGKASTDSIHNMHFFLFVSFKKLQRWSGDHRTGFWNERPYDFTAGSSNPQRPTSCSSIKITAAWRNIAYAKEDFQVTQGYKMSPTKANYSNKSPLLFGNWAASW